MSPSTTASPSRCISDLAQMLAEAFEMFDDTDAALPQVRRIACPLSSTSSSTPPSNADSLELFSLDDQCAIDVPVVKNPKSFGSDDVAFAAITACMTS